MRYMRSCLEYSVIAVPKRKRLQRAPLVEQYANDHQRGTSEIVRECASPSKKSVQRLKTTVGDLLVPGNNEPWPEVRDTLNRVLLGWSNYFSYGTRRAPLRGVDRYVYERVRDFLVRRHKVAGRGTRRFSCDVVYGERGLLRLERLPLKAPSCASR